ncbi:MAG: penicillin-binding protein 2 [Kiritimatiellae bacterium]|nr:penicillin-binding protein 2 [Kiritimatiellia bacterium]
MSSMYLSEHERARLRRVWVAMMVSLALLALQLWRIQVGQGERYETSLEQQSIRRVQIPGPRGRIFDRHGVCLADNRPNYCVALYLEELRVAGKRWVSVGDAWKLIQRVAAVIGLEPQLTRTKVESHLDNRKALPLIAWRRVDVPVLARLSEASILLPVVDVMVDADRVYPQGASASHLLGYVGTVERGNEENGYHSYWPDMVGKGGMEQRYDELLRGEPGGRLVRVDVSGFKHDQIGFRDPVPGGDLVLTLDGAIQRSAEKAMADVVGAVVVIDPRNGDVLALASSPGFDPNTFSPSISVETWTRMLEDSRKPLFNRAISGRYAPGSIFKPLVALAALESGKANARGSFDCQGYYEIGGQRFSCYEGEIHGRLDIRRALELSCNVFFYQLGLQCGLDPIYHLALAVGLGQQTGIDLDNETAGLLPGKAWKRIARGETWRDGDTCNLAIGQGALLVTPLQMAMVTATIANGGVVYQPRLVLSTRSRNSTEFQEVPPVRIRTLRWSSDHLALVKKGMRDVIQNPSGTGHLACLPDVIMAGKTGTAEYGRKGQGHCHGWMVLFAPYDQPRYAVAMVMDDAITGGVSIGPRMRQLMQEVLNRAGEEHG